MKQERDSEFHFSEETNALPKEFSTSGESSGMGNEFSRTLSPEPLYDEYNEKSGTYKAGYNENRHRRLKKMMLAPITSAIAAVSLVFASFEYDPLGSDFLNNPQENTAIVETLPPETSADILPSPEAPTEESTAEERWIETADDGFPVLRNLPPNGSVEGYGILNEEFIRLQSETEDLFIVSGSAWGYYDEGGEWHQAPLSTVSGVSYDASSNTLTLNNYSGSILNVNLMGNSFTINLIGDNHLDHLLVWGFYYGGSVTITGDGSLTINENSQYWAGIDLTAEFSETCLMVDSGVRLEVYGSDMAIAVHSTTMEKAIYYLKPLTLTGGIRAGGDYIIVSDGQYSSAYGNYQDYTIVEEETGIPAKHVIFE